MVEIINIADLPADPNNPDGHTIREENAKLKHNIPIGAVVKVNIDTCFGNNTFIMGTAQLFVVGHNRDCDGTPLYSLASHKLEDLQCMADFIDPENKIPRAYRLHAVANIYETGYGENNLTEIKT
jgi:hypothetical protein